MAATFEPRDFLNSIACLETHGKDAEDVQRTIAGRAYYAVYGTFKLQMGNSDIQHAALRAALAERSRAPAQKKKWKDITDRVKYLWDLRRESDYDYIGITMQQFRIELAVRYAKDLILEIHGIEPVTMAKLYKRTVEFERARTNNAGRPTLPDGFWP